jgi:hypothetical protein
MEKRSEHIIDKTDVELNNWEFQLVMGDAWEYLSAFENSIFCDCGTLGKKLIEYKVYLNKLNDIVLRGKCSGCNSIAARYIETGENSESFATGERIKKMKKDSL